MPGRPRKVSDDEVYQSIFDPQANHVERIQEALAVFPRETSWPAASKTSSS